MKTNVEKYTPPKADVIVLISEECVLAGSGLGSVRKLGGKTIGMNNAPRYAEALATTELKQTAGQIVITEDGNDLVFDGLYKGVYDAIVTDYATAKYYMR